MKTLCAPDNVYCLVTHAGDNLVTLGAIAGVAIIGAIVFSAVMASFIQNAMNDRGN